MPSSTGSYFESLQQQSGLSASTILVLLVSIAIIVVGAVQLNASKKLPSGEVQDRVKLTSTITLTVGVMLFLIELFTLLPAKWGLLPEVIVGLAIVGISVTQLTTVGKIDDPHAKSELVGTNVATLVLGLLVTGYFGYKLYGGMGVSNAPGKNFYYY